MTRRFLFTAKNENFIDRKSHDNQSNSLISKLVKRGSVARNTERLLLCKKNEKMCCETVAEQYAGRLDPYKEVLEVHEKEMK